MSPPNLPIHLAIRIVLDNVAYSNPLPDWHTPLQVDYAKRERRIRRKIDDYLSGRGAPCPCLEVQVPHRRGDLRTWVLPSVNDQIMLQACVSALERQLSSQVDPEHVYSYRRNDDPNRVALTEDKLKSWFDFQDATYARLEPGTWLLQLDLRRAFPSMDRQGFYRFLECLDPPGREVEIIRLLLDGFDGGRGGVPLINDTVFFLGNAYLSEVDGIVARHTRSFIRFMDDYHVFGGSEAELERVFEDIHRDLHAAGFEVNQEKLKLGDSKEFLEAPQPAFGTSGNFSTLVADVMAPADVTRLVVKALREPEKYLHEGFGRFLLGVVRRFRYEAVLADRFQVTPAEEALRTSLASAGVLPLASVLLERYGADPRQAWRAVWLIYLLEHMELDGETESLLERLEKRQETPEVVRLWARRARRGRQPEREILPEDLHDRGYLEAGLRCYGDQPC